MGFQQTLGVDFPLQHPEIRKKIAQNNIEKYGVDNPLKLEKFQEKRTEVFRKKYGVDTPFQVEEFRQKALQSMEERHGVKYSGQSPLLMEKVRKTSKEKYGTDYFMETEEFREMSKQTNNERYGTDNPMQNDVVKQKVIESMLKNGGIPTSNQQIYINQLIGGKLNHPVSGYPLDIAFIDEKIYVEYNGGGHDYGVKVGVLTREEFVTKTIKRYKTLNAAGWKLIEINSENDLLPSDETITSLISKAKEYLKLGKNWINIDVNRSIILSKEFQYKINLGPLRKIYLQ
ncbi:hypothetical protein J7E79_24135 [Bacillus sp. ISL-40]|uniref:DUF7487 domain-containing protein n=1 Tax=Bacillus sp. ISL-40 TaxID=2819126 RepID=UPI001BEAD040|nr:hypothetical protein [Bacillus sp. ISL-40]MBT2700430.1 hypothetical protein [Bacillus sp. ISL-40]